MVVCTRCLSTGSPKSITPGSIWLELLLWLLFLIPGVIYSVWRITARYKGCLACGAREIIPLASPAAQRLLGNAPQG